MTKGRMRVPTGRIRGRRGAQVTRIGVSVVSQRDRGRSSKDWRDDLVRVVTICTK